MKNRLLLPFLLFLVLGQLSFAQEKPTKQLVSFEKIASLSREDVLARWKKIGIPRFITPVKYGVDVYELIYSTCYNDSCFVKASGMYFVPQGKTKKPCPTMLYNHGTVIRPKRTGIDYNGESTICLMFATDGYAVLWPDYVGLAKGEGLHLYHHLESEANAGIDLLKAGRLMNDTLGIEINDQLFISGYSQGGHATMSQHKVLQEMYSDEFPVTASSPMSGAYDLYKTQGKVMYEYYTQPHYLPYLLMGYNEAYGLFPREKFFKIFVPPYDTIVPGMFDGKHGVGEINDALPDIPMDMLQPELVEAFTTDSTFYIRQLLKENSVYDWKPDSPVQFCYCKGDEEVLWENAIVAHDRMKALGAGRILKRHVGKRFTHRQCADYAVLYTKFFFDSFRKGSKKGRKGPVFKRMLIGIAKGIR